MIDFTNCEINKFKYYGGKNGGKICIIYNNEDYMLKFPGINEGISEHGYSNNCISEYIACKIIRTLDIKVQETLLGEYNLNGTEKTVVACKDFTSNGTILKQFAELKNSQIETSKNGYGTELNEVIQTIEEQQIYDVKELKEFFWDMFIAENKKKRLPVEQFVKDFRACAAKYNAMSIREIREYVKDPNNMIHGIIDGF